MEQSVMVVPTRQAHNTFLSLCVLAGSVVRHFTTDLYFHDARAIYMNPGRPFVHIAYDTGTHLFFLPQFTGSNEPEPYLFGHITPLDMAKDVYELIRDNLNCDAQGRPLNYTYYDGSTTTVVSHDKCVTTYHKAYQAMECAVLKARLGSG